MRTTNYTIECDRCGLITPVKDWSWSELRVLHSEGWSSYSSYGVNEYNHNRKQKRNDLCTECTRGMKAYMGVQDPESWENLFESRGVPDLVAIRKTLNKTMRIKRKANNASFQKGVAAARGDHAT